MIDCRSNQHLNFLGTRRIGHIIDIYSNNTEGSRTHMSDYNFVIAENILILYMYDCTRDRLRNIFIIVFCFSWLKMWLDRSYILQKILMFFLNETRDNCRRVSLELETVVFRQRKRAFMKSLKSIGATYSLFDTLFFQLTKTINCIEFYLIFQLVCFLSK